MNIQNKATVKILVLIMIVVFALSVFGCAPQNEPSEISEPAQKTEKTAEPTDNAAEPADENTDQEPSPTEDVPDEFTVTDMAGRTVVFPNSDGKIFCADPMSAITLYTLAPDRLLGWNYSLNETESSYILEEYRALPVFGMKDAINFEAVIAAGPSFALLTGTIGDNLIEQADQMQNKLGIPVLVLDNALTAAADVYAFLGGVTGILDQGSALSAYAQDALSSIADGPEDARETIYYANGIDSLNTSSKGSPASQLFDMVYADNVCDLPSEAGDRIQVTKEHIIEWNPSYIFVNGEPSESLSGSSAAQAIMDDPAYTNVAAVQNGNVISIPKSPFAWIDRPRSVNRLIGIRWLGSKLYPDIYTFTEYDIKAFYSLFYHMELTDEQVAELLSQ